MSRGRRDQWELPEEVETQLVERGVDRDAFIAWWDLMQPDKYGPPTWWDVEDYEYLEHRRGLGL